MAAPSPPPPSAPAAPSSPPTSTTARLARALLRPADSFHPRHLPVLARRSYALELATTFCFATTLAGIEGGVIGNLAKKGFDDVVPESLLRYAVAVLAAAPELANIVSFWWSSVAHGRPKIPLINILQLVVIALVLVVAFLPISPAGLLALVIIVVLARLSWSGIVTLRPTIWRANYPRSLRAQIVGRFSAVQVIAGATMAILVGTSMDVDERAFRPLLALAALLGIGAFLATRLQRVRRERALLAAEHAAGSSQLFRPWMGPVVVYRTLTRDRWWAKFMACMFILGLGNLLLNPTLIIILDEQFHAGYLPSMLVVTALPALATACAIPLWARFIDRAHVVRFRAIHSWTFVLSSSVLLLGALFSRIELLYLGAILQGVGLGGGALAWNLGHLDFATPAHTSQYMATHVTLNGVRGFIAPFAAVTLYSTAFHLPLGSSILGTHAALLVFSLALFLSILGSLGFVLLLRQMGDLAAASRRN